MFAGKKSAQIREILISESAWEEMTCLFAPSLTGQAKMADLVKAKKAKIIGNGAKLEEIIACLDNFDLWVNIVTPN